MSWCDGLAVRGTLRRNEAMARHCSWRAGGPAELLFEPVDLADLQTFLRAAPSTLPITWIGLGSNLLVRDGGLAGVVVMTAQALGNIARSQAGFNVGAGVPCAKLARQVALAGCAGAEFMVGIPGSVGGALAMNAGAFGGETWSSVRAVETIDRAGNLRVRLPSEFEIGYRHVRGPVGEWFTAGTFEFHPGAVSEEILAQGRTLLAQRSAAQPTGVASCGSVFRNPPGDHAGRLIEAAGFKGRRKGGCHVSEKHANFIINDRDASAGDIEGLMLEVQQAVKARFGVELQAEVRIIGEAVRSAAVTRVQ
jgi:UDP-N-acetylmuramate dehydrogenase